MPAKYRRSPCTFHSTTHDSCRSRKRSIASPTATCCCFAAAIRFRSPDGARIRTPPKPAGGKATCSAWKFASGTDPAGLTLSPFALSGVCLVTNRVNPVPGITRAQFQDIVAGRVTSWSQVPGSTRTDAIVPVTLDHTTGTRLVFESVFLDVGTPVAYMPRTFDTSPQARDFVAATPAALGYVDLAYAGPLHVLSLPGRPRARARRSARRPIPRSARSGWSPGASRAGRSSASCAGWRPAARRGR